MRVILQRVSGKEHFHASSELCIGTVFNCHLLEGLIFAQSSPYSKSKNSSENRTMKVFDLLFFCLRRAERLFFLQLQQWSTTFRETGRERRWKMAEHEFLNSREVFWSLPHPPLSLLAAYASAKARTDILKNKQKTHSRVLHGVGQLLHLPWNQ